jgi:hypothetical protein
MERWHTIICRCRAIWSGGRRRVSGGVALVAILALFVLVSGQVAQACPPGMEHGAHGALVNLPDKLTPAASIASTSAPTCLITADTGHCGGENGHPYPCGCQTGCSATGSAAIDVAISGLSFPEHSSLGLFEGPTGLVSVEPSPHFRPPPVLI